jgi:hypothetical protein
MPLLDPRSGPSYGTIEHENAKMNTERDQLLQDDHEAEGQSDELSTLEEMQEGVRKIEAINLTWTTKSVMVAYVRLVWLAVPCFLNPC